MSDSSHPPGPDGLPVVGNAVAFSQDPFQFFERVAREYGDVVYIPNVGFDLYLLTNPDHVERVLVSDTDTFRKPDLIRNQLGSVFGDGLLVSEGDFWRRQRQFIQPAFFRDTLAAYTELMATTAEQKVMEWEAGETYDMYEEMSNLALRILLSSLFGTDIDGKDAIAGSVRSLMERYQPRKQFLYTLLPEWVPTPTNLRYRRAIDHLDSVIEELTEQRRTTVSDRDDFLTRLLHATDDGTSMSDEALRDEMMNMLLAGHETSAVALTCTWYLLSKNPQVRERVQEELEETLGGETPTITDLQALTYTEKVFRESIRLYPPVYSIPRQPTEEIELGGYTIPEGTVLSLNAWVVHRDERWYDDPEQFRPERWSASARAKRPDYAYFPFSGGPRSCLGQQFELMEAKIVLATILQRVDLDLIADESLSLSAVGFTTQPLNGVRMEVTTR